jgi:hypothetical protein
MCNKFIALIGCGGKGPSWRSVIIVYDWILSWGGGGAGRVHLQVSANGEVSGGMKLGSDRPIVQTTLMDSNNDPV